jgi:2',3'-cyclic-nucleotide 2'-phosphodiesterase (5'-nucleotidase family)
MNSIRLMRAGLPLLAAAALAATASAQVRVQILHASDLEGDVDAVDNAPNFGAVVQALEAAAGSAGIPSLLLSAGDNYIPGPFYSAAGDPALRTPLRVALGNPQAREAEGRVDIALMNVFGFDASAVGNHEFDAGTTSMRAQIGPDIRATVPGGPLNDARWLGAQFPYLSANLNFAGDSQLAPIFTGQVLPNTAFVSPLANLPAANAAPKLARATLIQRGGLTFGVVGATTPVVQSISSTGGVTVIGPGAGTNDMVALAAVLQPTIDLLTNQGVDKIILVTHLQQIALEQQLVGLLQNVDIVIAGGSSTLLADATDRLRGGDVAQGSYPLLTTNANNQPALIVSTGDEYEYVGRLVVDFDGNGVLVPSSIDANQSGAFATDQQGVLDLWGNLVAPFAPGTKGGISQALVGAVRGVVIAKDSNILGRASVFLEGRRNLVRSEETNLGTLTAEANLAFARSFDASVHVSHKNGGGIRNPIGSIDGITGALLPTAANPLSGKLAGQISQLDVEDSLRFNNSLSLLTLTRPQLKAVLEHSVAATTATATPGQFGQWGGISFSFDRTRPAGDRVRYAGLTTPGLRSPILVAEGQVVGAAPVRIVTLDFLASGGDNYPFPAFVSANPAFANRVNLNNPALGLPPGAATFALPGTEQDALAEFLLANHSASPYAVAETPPSGDQVVQNLLARSEGVVAFVNPSFGIDLGQDLVGCGPLTLNVVGALPNARLFNLVSFGCSSGTGPLFGVGTDAFFQLFLPLGFEPVHVRASNFGIYSWSLPTACLFGVQLEAVAIEIDEFSGIPTLTRVSAPTPCTAVSL